MATDGFSLADMLEQLEQMDKMGPIDSVLEMLPGLAGKVSKDDIDLEGIKRQKAIIRSMTFKERANHLIIGPPRRKRIAKGSGTSVAEVNKLLKQFEKSRLMMKKLAKNKGMQAQFFNALMK